MIMAVWGRIATHRFPLSVYFCRGHVTVTWPIHGFCPLTSQCITSNTSHSVSLHHNRTSRFDWSTWHYRSYLSSTPEYLNFTSTSFPSRCLHTSIPSSGGSRLIPEGKKERRAKVKIRERRVLLIDDDGTNLGEMDGNMAVKLADSKGFKVVLVNRETAERCAVYKLMSGKKLYEEEKIRKLKAKKDPRQVTKEIVVSTKIDGHDLEVKLSHMKEILNKLHNVRVVIEVARIPRFSSDREERLKVEKEKQVKMIQEVEAALTGVGVKMAKENTAGRNRLQCTFRSTVSSEDVD